jgi:hypothetical protein
MDGGAVMGFKVFEKTVPAALHKAKKDSISLSRAGTLIPWQTAQRLGVNEFKQFGYQVYFDHERRLAGLDFGFFSEEHFPHIVAVSKKRRVCLLNLQQIICAELEIPVRPLRQTVNEPLVFTDDLPPLLAYFSYEAVVKELRLDA